VLAAQPGESPHPGRACPGNVDHGRQGHGTRPESTPAKAKDSMAIGIDLVKNGQADAFVTAGNTGAASVTASSGLG